MFSSQYSRNFVSIIIVFHSRSLPRSVSFTQKNVSYFWGGSFSRVYSSVFNKLVVILRTYCLTLVLVPYFSWVHSSSTRENPRRSIPTTYRQMSQELAFLGSYSAFKHYKSKIFWLSSKNTFNEGTTLDGFKQWEHECYRMICVECNNISRRLTFPFAQQ